MPATSWVDEPISIAVSAQPDGNTLAAWDRFVADMPGSDVTQLTTWTRIRQVAGFTPLYVFAYHRARLVAGAQILRRRLPVVGAMGYLPYGPLIAHDAPRPEVCRALGKTLQRLCRRRLSMLFVQPPECAEDMSLELLRHGFRPSHAGIASVGSIRLDLTASESELQRRLTRQLRRATKNGKWETNGIKIRIGDGKDLPVMAGLLAKTAAHQGFEPLSLEYLSLLYRELDSQGHVTLFIGEVNGVPVASELLTSCGGVSKCRITGFDRSDETVRLKVPGLIIWEAIRWAKANGYHWFDFGGLSELSLRILLSSAGDRSCLPGGDSFKVGFGGSAFRYPQAVELIRSPLLRGAYDIAHRSDRGRQLLSTARRVIRGGRQTPKSDH